MEDKTQHFMFIVAIKTQLKFQLNFTVHFNPSIFILNALFFLISPRKFQHTQTNIFYLLLLVLFLSSDLVKTLNTTFLPF